MTWMKLASQRAKTRRKRCKGAGPAPSQAVSGKAGIAPKVEAPLPYPGPATHPAKTPARPTPAKTPAKTPATYRPPTGHLPLPTPAPYPGQDPPTPAPPTLAKSDLPPPSPQSRLPCSTFPPRRVEIGWDWVDWGYY